MVTFHIILHNYYKQILKEVLPFYSPDDITLVSNFETSFFLKQNKLRSIVMQEYIPISCEINSLHEVVTVNYDVKFPDLSPYKTIHVYEPTMCAYNLMLDLIKYVTDTDVNLHIYTAHPFVLLQDANYLKMFLKLKVIFYLNGELMTSSTLSDTNSIGSYINTILLKDNLSLDN